MFLGDSIQKWNILDVNGVDFRWHLEVVPIVAGTTLSSAILQQIFFWPFPF